MKPFLYNIQRACGEIDEGAGYNCDSPLQGGAEPNVTLINLSDYVGVTIGSVPNLITNILLANGKSGYQYQGFGRSVSPQQEVITAGSGQNLWKHQVGIFVFDRSQHMKNTIAKIALGRFLAIVQSTAKDENAFELYGIGNGLELVPGVVQQLNENNGAYNLVLATKDGKFEAKPPQTVFATDYATTLALVQGLWYQPAVLNLNVLAAVVAGGTSFTVTGLNFFGGGSASAVTSVKWVNQSTLAETTQTSVTVSSNTQLTFSSVALAAGTYKLKVTTSKGSALSNVTVVVS